MARRAQQLATVADAGREPAGTQHYLRLRLAGPGWFGIARDCAREVLTTTGMAQVPGVPAHIAGIVSVRGNMITVLDLSAWFGIGRGTRERAEAIVIVEGNGMSVGLLVEELDGEFACAPGGLAPRWTARR